MRFPRKPSNRLVTKTDGDRPLALFQKSLRDWQASYQAQKCAAASPTEDASELVLSDRICAVRLAR